MNLDFLERQFLSNKLVDYSIALLILISSILIIKILRSLVIGSLKKWASQTSNPFDNVIIRILERNMMPIIYLGSFYLAIGNLTLHPILERALEVLVIMGSTILGIRLVAALGEYGLKIYWQTYHRDNPSLEHSIDAIIPALRIVLWLIGIIFILDNLGFNISAVVTSLGIGGVAIALASQGVLQDLFSYFAILLDRPFELGDFIIVGDYLGTVEYVGIKTTRLKSISGEEIIMANTDLTGSRIRNFKRMKERRIVFKFGVVYDTKVAQLKMIPDLIERIISATEHTRFDRAHFAGYGDFSLDFEVVYFIDSNDYTEYMNAQEQINLNVKAEFARHNIQFAYPTQINYLQEISAHLSQGNKSQEVDSELEKRE